MARSLSQINSKKSLSNTAEPTVFKLISFSFHCSSHDKQRGFSIIQSKKEKVRLYAQANAQLSAAVHTIRFGKHTFAFANPKQQFPGMSAQSDRRKKKMCPDRTLAAAGSILLPDCPPRLVLALLQCCSLMKILLLSPRIFLMLR
jgi:hypothetical protein